jgi:hypothetical protein
MKSSSASICFDELKRIQGESSSIEIELTLVWAETA